MYMHTESRWNMENRLQLGKQIIMFAGFFITAAFEKRECDACKKIDRFPMVDWGMTWPVYARETCFYIVLMAWAFVLYYEHRNKWMLIAFILVIGAYLNFALRANFMWFRVNGYPFGYTAFAALIFFICIFLQMMNGFSRLRH